MKVVTKKRIKDFWEIRGIEEKLILLFLVVWMSMKARTMITYEVRDAVKKIKTKQRNAWLKRKILYRLIFLFLLKELINSNQKIGKRKAQKRLIYVGFA